MPKIAKTIKTEKPVKNQAYQEILEKIRTELGPDAAREFQQAWRPFLLRAKFLGAPPASNEPFKNIPVSLLTLPAATCLYVASAFMAKKEYGAAMVFLAISALIANGARKTWKRIQPAPEKILPYLDKKITKTEKRRNRKAKRVERLKQRVDNQLVYSDTEKLADATAIHNRLRAKYDNLNKIRRLINNQKTTQHS